MDNQSAFKPFDFHEKIDSSFIFSLYEDDYLYIASVFSSSRETITEEYRLLKSAPGDITAVKRAIHKIKPAFGFSGMLWHEQQLGDLEKSISHSSSANQRPRPETTVFTILEDGIAVLSAQLDSINRLQSS